MNPGEALITKVLMRYYPSWEAPPNRGKWNKCRCAVHDEDRPSASVSYELDAFTCHGCGYRGNALSIIMREEEISFNEAVKRAEELSPGSGKPLSRQPARKPRRRLFGDEGADGPERGGGRRTFPSGLR